MSRRGLALAAAALAAGALLSALGGCATVGYLSQSVQGHLDLLRAARPVADWMADPQTPSTLRERLELAVHMREFSVHELRLPDNNSYRRFADLHRAAAVWNVVAAPELSLRLKTTCFPVVGCVGYRGFFDRAAADREAERLRAEGFEVSVYGVPAYSTLGKLPGEFFADPLLSTFIRYPEGELARLVFHELAHQVAYASGDTEFNESFATTVERIGGGRWLERESSTEAREEYERFDARRRDFKALALATRARLLAIYQGPGSDEDKRAAKAAAYAEMRAEHARLKAGPWAGYAGYDRWFETANNASLGVQAAYNALVPGFEALFRAQGGSFPRFYAEVERLAKRADKADRRAELQHALEGRPVP